jgi:Fe2+ or Zn2+ uptake regulation protein
VLEEGKKQILIENTAGDRAPFTKNIKYRPELDKALAEHTGYMIAFHRMIFEGLCPDCQNKMRNEEKEICIRGLRLAEPLSLH